MSANKQDKKKSRRKRQYDALSITYIYKVLRQVHPDTGMTASGFSEIQGMLYCALNKIACKCSRLTKLSKLKTVTANAVLTATKMSLPGELAKHALSEGNRAVTKYNQSAQGDKNNRQTKTSRAGLQFSVARMKTYIRENCCSSRVSIQAAVFLTAVMEYLAAEIMELAGNVARKYKRVRINARHITLAVGNDEELDKLFVNYHGSGGVVPGIHAVLKKKKK